MTPAHRPVRIPPEPPEEWSDRTRAVFSAVEPFPVAAGAAGAARTADAPKARPLHLPGVVARHPTLLEPYMSWATAVARHGVLAPRDSALLALRTALRCESEFEWGVHATYAFSRAGLDDADVRRVASGPDEPGWSARDAALLRAADELHDRHAIGDDTWGELARSFGVDALLEIVFVVGHYTMLSMVANSAGVQPQAGWSPLPVTSG